VIPGKTPLTGQEIAVLIQARELIDTKFFQEQDAVNRTRLSEAHTALVTVLRHSYVDVPKRRIENTSGSES
jgi:hypothetical protein